MNYKKISLFIALSFGISWSVALIMKLAGITYGSTTSALVTGALFMPGPAIAVFILQKFIYNDGFTEYGWSFDNRKIKLLLLVPVLFLGLFGLTLGSILLLGNYLEFPNFGKIDFSEIGFNTRFTELLKSKIDDPNVDINSLPSIPSWLFFIISLVQGVAIGGLINIPFMFGEEFGWRGLLLKETRMLGFLKSNLFVGLVWGVWHLPLILMGHNYPENPNTGILMMCLFTICLSPIFSYITLKTKTILGACLLHGMINGTAQIYGLYVIDANALYGSPAGVAGVIGALIITLLIVLFDKTFFTQYKVL